MVDRLRRVGEGVYRSTRPMPLHGSWKVGLRLQRGRARGAVPVRLPPDPALGPRGAELRAPARFTRRFDADSKIMLREQAANKSAWLWMVSIAVIFAFYAALVAGLALGVARLGRRARDADPVPAPPLR